MLWRSWAFACGIPVGAALGLAALAAPTPVQLALAALAGGVVFAALVSLLARRDVDPARGPHLAAASSAGWCALPAAVAIFFGWQPGRWVWVAAIAVVLAVAFWKGTRDPGPGRGPVRWALRALASTAIAALAVVGAAGAVASFLARPVEPGARFASVLYSVDAGVVTRPLPICDGVPRAVTVLHDGGADPALTPDDRYVFFDAPVAADGGRRQIHRLDRASGEVRCWTCGDPGNNRHPSVSTSGVSLVFESDRDATWRHPDETELYLAGIAERPDVVDPGRRLSFLPGPDSHPVFGPGPQMVTWSRREAGRYQIVSAGIRGGHGGILLGNLGVIADGGARWIAPIAWSADGRSLVFARGNPFAALEGGVLDPATGSQRALGAGVGLGAAANGDGAWLAWTTTHSRHPAGALPEALGFALAPFAVARASTEALRADTGLRIGPIDAPADAPAVALPPEVASWGEPAGLAFAGDASAVVLGQRRSGEHGLEERLVQVELACTQVATAPRAVPVAK